MTSDTRPELVDSHCHLDFPDFADELPDVIARAREQVGETRLQSLAVGQTLNEDVAEQLRNIDVQLNELQPRLASTRAQIARNRVRAPVSGQVVGLTAFTQGGKPVFGGIAGRVIEEGWLEQQLSQRGVKLEWIALPHAGAGPQINEGFSNNSLDFAVRGDLPSVIAGAGQVPGKLIVPGGSGNNAARPRRITTVSVPTRAITAPKTRDRLRELPGT